MHAWFYCFFFIHYHNKTAKQKVWNVKCLSSNNFKTESLSLTYTPMSPWPVKEVATTGIPNFLSSPRSPLNHTEIEINPNAYTLLWLGFWFQFKWPLHEIFFQEPFRMPFYRAYLSAFYQVELSASFTTLSKVRLLSNWIEYRLSSQSKCLLPRRPKCLVSSWTEWFFTRSIRVCLLPSQPKCLLPNWNECTFYQDEPNMSFIKSTQMPFNEPNRVLPLVTKLNWVTLMKSYTAPSHSLSCPIYYYYFFVLLKSFGPIKFRFLIFVTNTYFLPPHQFFLCFIIK